MQTLKTITLFGTVSNSATSRTSRNGRHYTAFGVSILNKMLYTAPSESDVFEDQLSTSAKRHARGREAVFSSWVVSIRMFARIRSDAVASAIRRTYFLESPAA